MLNILLFSKNKKNSDLIVKTLDNLSYKSLHYKAQVIDEFDIEAPKSINVKLFIIDISNLNIEAESSCNCFFEQITRQKIPAILILAKDQTIMIQGLKDLINTFEDILFEERIKDELGIRVNFALSKSKVLNTTALFKK